MNGKTPADFSKQKKETAQLTFELYVKKHVFQQSKNT
jgi:hypothetical protein